jgi:phospholipid/cholesterol/gamma-HCH transport system substrate-binding protein
MITKRTKVQLVIFALITMIGVSFVGARYARLDRLVFDQSYKVVAHFDQSGGIFTGAEVAYRGVTIGRVSDMNLTDKGVDVVLDIEKNHKDIPEKTKAVVANRSAVGEQFVDLQPQSRKGTYLADGSDIPMAMTATPIETTQLLTDLDTTVNSVNKQSLTTVVDEFGKAFNGTGGDLGQIVDTSNSFIRSANANFDITTALLEDSNKVLATQVDKTSAIKSFSRDLSLFSTTLANSDGDLRRVIENGSATANQLRTFLEQNKVDLGQLINNLVTTGEVTGRHLDGTEMILVVYPYVVAGGYTVVAKDRSSGLYDAHFGLILQQDPPVCKAGYNTRQRDPNRDRGDVPMNTRARCTEPASKSNARGAQNTPRRAGPSYRAPVVGTYDRGTGKLSYTDTNPSGDVTYTGGAAALMGEESWKWLLMQPLSGQE